MNENQICLQMREVSETIIATADSKGKEKDLKRILNSPTRDTELKASEEWLSYLKLLLPTLIT